MAGYNDPGHPAGLPSEPSPRRLPAGDGSGATAQMEGLQGPGSLQPGFRQCCFPNLKRKDARCKRTAGEREKPTARTCRTESPPRGEREATRPKRKQGTKAGPRNPKRTEETPKSRGKHPSGKFLEERERVGEAIAERDRGHVPQGDYQTSMEVWQSPAPESVVETQKVTAKATHTKNPAPILSVSSS